MPMRHALNKIHRVPVEFHKEFDLLCTKRSIYRKDLLLTRDHYCDQVFFLHEGIMRLLKNERGQEATIWIISPGQIVHVPKRFFNEGGKSIFDIQALTDGVVSSISKEQVRHLKVKYPELDVLCEKVSERFEKNYEHYLRLLTTDADTRYDYIVEHFLDLVDSEHIETLSSFMFMSKRTYYRCLKRRMKNGI